MVAIWPSFISCLMTSDALTAILCASSATRDGFGHVHFEDRAPRPVRPAMLLVVTATVVAAAAARAAAPVAATDTTAGIAAGLDFLLLGRIAGPARRELGRLDFLACARRAPGAAGCSAGAARAAGARGLVQRALDARPCSGRRLLGRLVRHQHAGRCVHHRRGWRRLRPRRPCGGARRGPWRARLLRRRGPSIRRRPWPSRLPWPAAAAACAAAWHRRPSALQQRRRPSTPGAAAAAGWRPWRCPCARGGCSCCAAAFLGGFGGASCGFLLGLLGASRPARVRGLPALRAGGASRPALLPGGGSARPGGALLPRGGPVRLRRCAARQVAAACSAASAPARACCVARLRAG